MLIISRKFYEKKSQETISHQGWAFGRPGPIIFSPNRAGPIWFQPDRADKAVPDAGPIWFFLNSITFRFYGLLTVIIKTFLVRSE